MALLGGGRVDVVCPLPPDLQEALGELELVVPFPPLHERKRRNYRSYNGGLAQCSKELWTILLKKKHSRGNCGVQL